MTREELRTLGLTDEQVDAVMKSHGKDVNELNAKIVTATNEVTRLKDVEKDFADYKEQNPIPKEVDPELKKALDQIKELKDANLKKDITSYLLEKGISGEDSVNLLNSFGSDIEVTKKAIDSIAKLISDSTNAAVEAKVKEFAQGGSNPSGGMGGSEPKTEDVKNAESISFGSVDTKEAQTAQDYYK